MLFRSEKALAANHAGLERMFQAAQRHPDLVFGGVFQHRFDPEYRIARRLVEEGRLGTMLTAGVQVRCLRTDDYYRSAGWRGTWEQEGGAACINQAIHYIDVALWIMGGADSLCATWTNLTHSQVMETEDTAAAVLRFTNGAVGTLEATVSSHLGWETSVAFHGTESSIEIRNEKPVKIAFTDEKIQTEVEREFADCRNETSGPLGKSYYGTGHLSQIRDFVDAIGEGRAPFVTAVSARSTVQTVLAIYEASEKGCWVKLQSGDQD